MPVPLSEVGRRGRLNLEFSCRNGETVLSNSYCETPFKITRLQNSHSSRIAHLILMQSTAGLFGGDVVDCAIHVKGGARILITQQSATKAHPSRGRLAAQNTQIRVDSGGTLHIYYEPVIPFSDARISLTTSIDVEEGARLYFWESLMAGRIARGEIWRFDEFSSETGVRLNGRLIYLDRFRLKPTEQPPISDWVMAGARYLATGVCFDDRASDLAANLHRLMPDAGVDAPEPGLMAVRLAVCGGPEFHQSRMAFTSNLLASTEPDFTAYRLED
jgi:urease accessory protein